jgi:hypothetical protein
MSPITHATHAVIDRVEVLRNSEVDDESISQLMDLIWHLIDLCNTEILNSFPIKVVKKPIDNITFEIG